MDIDDDDDLYAPEEAKVDTKTEPVEEKTPANSKPDDLEEGEEEDEGDAAMDEDEDDDSDSDIDIITERKDGTVAQPPPLPSKYSDIRNIPQRSTSTDTAVKPATTKSEERSRGSAAKNISAPTADKASEAASKSTVDINANPVYPAAGKPITQVNIDEGKWQTQELQRFRTGTNPKILTDLPDNDKPWRKPGTDISDYFNYGFDEFTWALYASKQESVRGEFGGDMNKKMMDDFNMMMMGGMGMGGGAGGPAAGNNAGAGAGGMPGMEGMPPEMQAMMQQMMASGMDPSQMDPNQMQAMMAGMQGGGQGGEAAQGQFGGGGYGGNQGGFGYNQGMGGQGGGGGGRGGFGGRGRRGRW